MSAPTRVCVVGAGVSGLATVKALRDAGVCVSCLESGDRIGGLWAFGNEGGNPTAYRSLRMNTSRARSAFAAMAMTGDPRGFATHDEVGAYLEAYADRFGLHEHVRLRTRVETAVRDGHGWLVSLAGGGNERFDAVVAASGRHAIARRLPLPPDGTFDGRVLHAGAYVDASQLAGRDVVVVGLGGSAADIAVEVSQVARSTVLSARSGVHVLPRRFAGRPIDQLELPLRRRLPGALAGPATGLLLRALLALPGRRPQDHRLPRPSHPFGAAHPTMSDELFERIDAGAITPRGALTALTAGHATFAGGARARAEVVIFATGYRAAVPFLAADLQPTRDGAPALFGHVLQPGVAGLWHVGFVAPIGPTPPLCELQAELVAAHASGSYAPPSADAMHAEVREAGRRRERYSPSPRHALEVDFWAYCGWLRRELERGRRRARGGGPAITPRHRGRGRVRSG